MTAEATYRDPTPELDREFWEKTREMHFEAVKTELESIIHLSED